MNSLLCKLGSIAVHAEEYLSPDGNEVDKGAILGLLQDPEVQKFFKENAVFLPRKRVGPTWDDRRKK